MSLVRLTYVITLVYLLGGMISLAGVIAFAAVGHRVTVTQLARWSGWVGVAALALVIVERLL